MFNSKVIDILKTFSPEEIKRFSEFLDSPFHNKNKKAILLFSFLTKFHPDYDSKYLTKEKLFEKIFSGDNKRKEFSDALIRNLLSDLFILLEKFLAYYRFEKDKFDFNEKSLREIIDRKLLSVFEKKLKLYEESLDKNEFEGEEQFYKKFVLEELKGSGRQFSDNLKLYKDDSHLKASGYLSYFYLIKIFKMINFFEFQKQYNVKHEFNFAVKLIDNLDLKKVFEGISDNPKTGRDHLVLSVYYRMYRAISNPLNEELYYEFKKSLLENDRMFSLLERYGLYICLTNSCTQKIDNGNEKFFKECFEMHMLMLDENLYSAYPGYFPLSAFSGILNTGLAAGEFQMVEKFIDNYSLKLNPVHSKDASNYSLAQLNFYLKKFDKALEYISKTDTEFSQFKYHLKMLTLKIYYETEDYNALYYAVDSFRHFLNKNKIVGELYRTEFGNFLKILDLIVKYRSIKDKKTYLSIKQYLDSGSIASKRWLKEKFDEIK